MNLYSLLQRTERQRVSDRAIAPILQGIESTSRQLVLIWPQLGDFDSLEYAWWLQRERQQIQDKGIAVRAVGIGDSRSDPCGNRASDQQFCSYVSSQDRGEIALVDRVGAWGDWLIVPVGG